MASEKKEEFLTREEAKRLAAREKESDEQRWLRGAIREELHDVLTEWAEGFFAPADGDRGGNGEPKGEKKSGGLLEAFLGPKS